MSRFDEHHEALKAGEYPPVHGAFQAFVGADIEGKRVLDLGCCTGGLTLWAARHGAAEATGFDERDSYIRRARDYRDRHMERDLTAARAAFERVDICSLGVGAMRACVRGYEIVFARRVLPELGYITAGRLAEALRLEDCEAIFIEGRVRSSKANNALWNVDLEVVAALVIHGWQEARRKGQIVKLVRA